MQRVNNYDKDVFNGATGIIIKHHAEFGSIEVTLTIKLLSIPKKTLTN